ncbi:hypothetical protein H6G97_49820 [Nostoc flagelliforme FACHB-838]|uniref:Uncharacterized protein n=1 Tax=Nostoc flagelliforme FACHB-838 TaxID=2692904 RepID=A0ABR8E5U4_9NOSO|nr:hypothetical protein [Nostoc flagelliforme]MBD2536890.1 hypothetical protein [Nostoc flagelliforme FACHB-838]
MATSDKSNARLRSATDFPKTIESFDPSEANKFYEEMRDCLIFSNRSRSQLIRRNEEHKQTILKVKTDFDHLQGMISQLKKDKESLAEGNQKVITALELQIETMSGHLDKLSSAFDSVSDIGNASQAQWGYLSFPDRFFNLVKAIKIIVLWWREEKYEEPKILNKDFSQLHLYGTVDDTQDNKPQMNTDIASQQRAERE